MPTDLDQIISQIRSHPILRRKKKLQRKLRKFERRLKIYQAKTETMPKQ